MTGELSRLVREASVSLVSGAPLEGLMRRTAALAGFRRAVLVRPGMGRDTILVDSDPAAAELADLPAGSVRRRPLEQGTLCLVEALGESHRESVLAAEAAASLVLGILDVRAVAAAGGPSGAAVARDGTGERGPGVDEMAEQALRWAPFLAEASRSLSRSVGYQATAERVARLAVPLLADYCVVDVIEGSAVRRLAVVHADPSLSRVADQLRDRYPPDPRWPEGISRVLHSGETDLVADVTPERLASVARDAGHLRLLEELGTSSALCVPMVARGRLVGGISLLYGTSRRRHVHSEIPVAEDLGLRAGLAIENARLYAEARETVLARDEFLSIASHELRTPVASLRLAAQGLARLGRTGRLVETPATAVAKSLDVVDRQSERLVQLIDKLLDVSRLEAGRLELDLEQVDLAALAREVVAQSSPQLAAVGCRLTVDAPEAVVGRWDSARVAHILQNLLANAAKYGAGRPVRVIVERREGWARLVVADRGIGIPTELQPRLFERFERAVSAQHYGGLGLGLYVVRRLTEALGGRVFVTSSEGEGATFVVELPVEGPVLQGGAGRQP